MNTGKLRECNVVIYTLAIDDGDYLRALVFLETLEDSTDSEPMWRTLAELTLQEGLLKMAERLLLYLILLQSNMYPNYMYTHCRCFAAIGDISKARYLRDINELAKEITAKEVSIFTDTNLHICTYVS